MINIEKILKQDRQIRATTGLNQQAFEALLPSFEEAYQETLDQKRRWRAAGGGRKATLKTSADKLFFILLYCKCYPTFDLMSVLFGFDRSCAHDWVHRLMPILETALGKRQALPERKIDSIEEFLAKFGEVQEVIIRRNRTTSATSKRCRTTKRALLRKKNGIQGNTLQVVPVKSGSFY